MIRVTNKRAKEGGGYTPRVVRFGGWAEHADVSCSICQHISVGPERRGQEEDKAGGPAVAISHLQHHLMLLAESTLPETHQLLYSIWSAPYAAISWTDL